MAMAGDQEKLHATYAEWIAVTQESMAMWLDMVQGRRLPDPAVLLELANKMQRLHAAFIEASMALTGFKKL
jgi:hypothetical protein